MYKNRLRLSALAVGLFTSVSSMATTLEVCNTCAHLTVQDAVTNAVAGDTIFIRNGTYNEHDIEVDKRLTFLGESQSGTIIDAQNNGRHFAILESADAVAFDNITLKNGDSRQSTMNCGSFTTHQGGSICAKHVSIKLWQMKFEDNKSGNIGGAIYLMGDNATSGYLVAGESSFIGNSIPGPGSGGGGGGAIACSYCDVLEIEGSEFVKNSADTDSLFNPGTKVGIGGAIAIWGTNKIESQRNVYDSNYAHDGGGAMSIGPYIGMNDRSKIVNDTFQSNLTPGVGGAIMGYDGTGSGDLAIFRSTFVKNVASSGGALHSTASFYIDNSTFTANNADEFGGAIRINSAYKPFEIANSTFHGNSVDDSDHGSVISTYALLQTGDIKISNSIFFENDGIECDTGGGGFVVGEHNLTDTDSCDPANGANSAPYGYTLPFSLGQVTDFDTNLANNGGFTMTHAIGAGSNAISNAARDCPSSIRPGQLLRRDQRGFNRDKKCDIGAYEYQ